MLVVSKHADGTYAVLDGQHRLSAMRCIGKAAANCIVLEGLTVQQEADYFRRQNENKQALRITDTFNASIWAEDAESLRITELVGKYGFRFGKSGIPMCICAIAALQKTVQLFGFDTLESVLATVAATWPTDTTILRREMLAGLAEFWSRFADQTTVQQFASRMAQKLPMDMYVEARNRSAGKANPGTAFNKGARFVTAACWRTTTTRDCGRTRKTGSPWSGTARRTSDMCVPEMKTLTVALDAITVADRIRKDNAPVEVEALEKLDTAVIAEDTAGNQDVPEASDTASMQELTANNS